MNICYIRFLHPCFPCWLTFCWRTKMHYFFPIFFFEFYTHKIFPLFKHYVISNSCFKSCFIRDWCILGFSVVQLNLHETNLLFQYLSHHLTWHCSSISKDLHRFARNLQHLCKSSEILEHCHVNWWHDYRIYGSVS